MKRLPPSRLPLFHPFNSFTLIELPAVRKSFTLIELLVVVTIISILAALLLPALKGARDQAKSAKCMSNLKQLGTAIYLYADDWDGFLPMARNETAPTEFGFWFKLISPYLHIPTDIYAKTDRTDTVFWCPAHEGKQRASAYSFRQSYGSVGALKSGGGYFYRFGAIESPNTNTPLRVTQFRLPSDSALLGENDNYYRFMFWLAPNIQYIDWHHQRFMNFLFADGHVASMSRDEFARRTSDSKDLFMRDY